MSNPHVSELNDTNFDAFIKDTALPVLVDFWAPWCGPCRQLGPVIEQIASESVGKFAIAKVNVDESAQVAAKFGIRSIPTLIFFKGGKLVEQVVGGHPKAELLRRLEALV